eukprot:Hpha_TRINITY_DN13413_c0_g1::TRINITY_DN13413_c0_g1_i1::g.131181::m.131181
MGGTASTGGGFQEQCPTGERGAWGYGPTTSEGLPTHWAVRPVGVLCEANGLTTVPFLNGRRGLKVDAAASGRVVIDFGGVIGQKRIKETRLRELGRHEGSPEVSVSSSGILITQDNLLLQRMPLGDISRVITVDGSDGTEHILCKAFEGRRSLYLRIDSRTDLARKLIEALSMCGRPKLRIEPAQYWYCGGDASFAARLRLANCDFPLRPDGRRLAEWWPMRCASMYALLVMRCMTREAASDMYRQPNDVVLGVLSYFGWAQGAGTLRAEGLEGAKELNLRQCRAVRAQEGRIVVAFDSGGVGGEPSYKSLNPANLRRLRLDGVWMDSDAFQQWWMCRPGQW